MPHTDTFAATAAPRPATVSRASRRSLALGVLGLALIAAVTVSHGITTRAQEHEKLRQWTETQAISTVAVVSPVPGGQAPGLELPGRLEAHSEAPIFARIGGYLKSWKVEIGTPVKAGQLLAEIETPELDQQLLQAKADLATIEADARLAASTARRWKELLATDSAAQQEVDEKIAAATAREAALKSARANLDRYAALKGFTRIVAPFDGVVTARNASLGALVKADGGEPLFVVSDIHNLRVYVSVPQSQVPKIPPGAHATLRVPERPERGYTATVSATAKAVDAASGTSLMQLKVDNASGQLLPGGYASVTLDLPKNPAALTVPASALIIDARGVQVATLASDDRVVLKPVTITRDLGKVVELASGLTVSDRLIDSPPDGIATGDAVRVAANVPGKAGGKAG
jgi:RND family efflux transporter MFP subunit